MYFVLWSMRVFCVSGGGVDGDGDAAVLMLVLMLALGADAS